MGDSLDMFLSHNGWETLDFLQTQDVGVDYETGTPSIAAPVELDNTADTNPREQTCTVQPDKLSFVQLADWDEGKTYVEDPPNCIHYSIEWKVNVNNKVVSKDTEQNVVLAPDSFWNVILRPKLEKLLRRKVPHNRCVRSDDANVVVSVTERSERDLTKRFDDNEIDWSIVEKQLMAWGELFHAGKKLRVVISFNYVETSQESTGSVKKGDKRGRSSTTQQMLTERVTFDADETPGQTSCWRDVYNLMRCPGPPCHLGPHCWRDPVGKRHYKVKTHHFRSLIQYVQQGHLLRTHDDVPEDIRDQLYAEEQQRLERKQAVSAMTPPSSAPINITNVLPGNSPQVSSHAGTPASMQLSKPSSVEHLDIPGLRDVAVQEYSEWQQSKVQDGMLKGEFRRARDAVLMEGLDLEQVHEDQDPEFLVKNGIKRGIARRFVRDIGHWAKRYKIGSNNENIQ
jgi:hypothetical protein